MNELKELERKRGKIIDRMVKSSELAAFQRGQVLVMLDVFNLRQQGE